MNILIVGYGKMGKTIAEVATQKGHNISGVITKDTDGHSFKKAIELAEVAIEFSTPGSAEKNVLYCLEHHLPVVCGTTGWDTQKVQQWCRANKGSLIIEKNFSLGVHLFFALNHFAARLMAAHSAAYAAHLEETHHIHKKDSPSGTALALQAQIKQITHSAPPIISHRVGEVSGTHDIIYKSDMDTIRLTHQAHNRSGFALGAVLAAEYIHDKTGIFSMRDLLNISYL